MPEAQQPEVQPSSTPIEGIEGNVSSQFSPTEENLMFIARPSDVVFLIDDAIQTLDTHMSRVSDEIRENLTKAHDEVDIMDTAVTPAQEESENAAFNATRIHHLIDAVEEPFKEEMFGRYQIAAEEAEKAYQRYAQRKGKKDERYKEWEQKDSYARDLYRAWREGLQEEREHVTQVVQGAKETRDNAWQQYLDAAGIRDEGKPRDARKPSRVKMKLAGAASATAQVLSVVSAVPEAETLLASMQWQPSQISEKDFIRPHPPEHPTPMEQAETLIAQKYGTFDATAVAEATPPTLEQTKHPDEQDTVYYHPEVLTLTPEELTAVESYVATTHTEGLPTITVDADGKLTGFVTPTEGSELDQWEKTVAPYIREIARFGGAVTIIPKQNPDGSGGVIPLLKITKEFTADTGLNLPVGSVFFVNPDGSFNYLSKSAVEGSHIEVFTADQAFVDNFKAWYEQGKLRGLNEPTFPSPGDVLVAEMIDGNQAIQIITKEGVIWTFFGTIPNAGSNIRSMPDKSSAVVGETDNNQLVFNAPFYQKELGMPAPGYTVLTDSPALAVRDNDGYVWWAIYTNPDRAHPEYGWVRNDAAGTPVVELLSATPAWKDAIAENPVVEAPSATLETELSDGQQITLHSEVSVKFVEFNKSELDWFKTKRNIKNSGPVRFEYLPFDAAPKQGEFFRYEGKFIAMLPAHENGVTVFRFYFSEAFLQETDNYFSDGDYNLGSWLQGYSLLMWDYDQNPGEIKNLADEARDKSRNMIDLHAIEKLDGKYPHVWIIDYNGNRDPQPTGNTALGVSYKAGRLVSATNTPNLSDARMVFNSVSRSRRNAPRNLTI